MAMKRKLQHLSCCLVTLCLKAITFIMITSKLNETKRKKSIKSKQWFTTKIVLTFNDISNNFFEKKNPVLTGWLSRISCGFLRQFSN